MLEIPPIPTWDALHPLIIHFPIALLFLSPVFILISAIAAPAKSRPYLASALIILLLGTGGLFLAQSTGKAAAELAERGGPIDAVLETHEDLASETAIVFSLLSAILFGLFFAPRVLRQTEARLMTTYLPVAFLVLYSVGMLFLMNTAHAGGRLVHEFGVHAIVQDSGSPDPATASASPPSQSAAH